MPIGQRTLIMGILNITPDSFSDGDELIDFGDEFEILFLAFTEPDTGIDHDRFALHTAPLGHVYTRTQTRSYFVHDVRNWRKPMHRGWCAA